MLHPDIENQQFMMFDGSFKAMKDLKVGDQLMGDDSTPCTIQSITPREEESYMIRPSYGDTYVIGESETLCLQYTADPGIYWDNSTKQRYIVTFFDQKEKRTRSTTFPVKNYGKKEEALRVAEIYKNSLDNNKKCTMRLKEYLSKTKSDQINLKTYRTGIEFPERKFEIDPYFIGYWLGDGSHNDSLLTIGKQDNCMVDYFRKYFEENFGLNFVQVGDKIDYRVSTCERGHGYDGKNIVKKYIRDKNLYKNKHIPPDMLYSSRETRLRLLAGLLDSDGYYDKDKNMYEFLQKRENLFDSVLFLARSLGFSCFKHVTEKTCTNSPQPFTGTYFRCNISGKNLSDIPCMIDRKKAVPNPSGYDLVNAISVNNIGVYKNYLINTDNPRFLMSTFRVRHRYVPILNIISK